MSRTASKREATLRALAALHGMTLYRTETVNGHEAFIITRWLFTRELRNLETVESFLAVQGVRR